MPALVATTEQVYVDTFVAETGPVVEVQVVTPLTPVIAQVGIPVGAIAPTGPETVAVKDMVEPRVPVPELALTKIVGVAVDTVVILPDVGDVAE